MNAAGERELWGFLQAIDERLRREGFERKVDLFVFGGAAAVIAYGSKRGTMDLDAHVADGEIKRKLLELGGPGTEIARAHGIIFQSANLDLMLIETPDWMVRCVEILRGRLERLRVLALGKEDLILSKLGRYNDRDREDIRFLAEERKADVKRLISQYKSARLYYVGDVNRLDATFNVVLREHYGRKPL